MKTKLIIIYLLLFGSCTKNSDPIGTKDQEEQEEVQDGVKLGYSLAKGKWHQVTAADVTGQIYFAKDDIYRYGVEGTVQYTSYLHRFDASTQTWVKLYEQLNPQAEKVATDPNGNVYMAITHLRTEGWGVGTTKFFYTYTIHRLKTDDQWEFLGEIPNPTYADFTMMELFHVHGKLHFAGLRKNKQLVLYSLNNGNWTETTSIDNVRHRLYGLIHHLRSNGDLTLAIAKTDQPNVIVSYTFNGSQLLKTNEDTFLTDVYLTAILGEDGLYNGAKEGKTTDAVLIRSHDQKEIFNLPAVTIQNHKYDRTVNKLAASGTKVYAQVQRYVIPEWLNEVLAVYDTSTGKTIWIPNTPEYNSKAVINDVVNRGKRHYFMLQKQVLNVSQRHLYYFEEE